MNPQNTDIFQAWGWLGIVIVSVVLLAATAVLAEWLVRLARRAFEKATGGREGGSIFNNIIRVVIWLVGIGLILYVCFDFNVGVIWGALGIGGIALSLGAQTTISNLLGGLQVTFSRDLSIGDWITVGGVTGQVKDITWRQIVVQDDIGYVYHIPNSTMTSSTVTRLPDYNCVTVPLVLKRGCDIDAISKELPPYAHGVVKDSGMIYEDMEPTFVIDGTELAGVSCRLFVYADRSYSTTTVKLSVVEPILQWLKDRDALVGYE